MLTPAMLAGQKALKLDSLEPHLGAGKLELQDWFNAGRSSSVNKSKSLISDEEPCVSATFTCLK
jgi:hypothetical protein